MIAYKYTDQAGARAILTDRTLLFSSPFALNDPFDVYIDDLFGMDVGEVCKEIGDVFFKNLSENPALLAAKYGVSIEDAEIGAHFWSGLSEHEKMKLKPLLNAVEERNPILQKRQDDMKAALNQFIIVFRTFGVFCTSKTHDNLLMWAHYAEKHKGVVLGFQPDAERDSFLRLIRPVTYREERPSFVDKTQLECIHDKKMTSEERATYVLQGLLHTKSSEWAYEQELRLALPYKIPDGGKQTLLGFLPNELVEMYLGCRMTDGEKMDAITLAKKINPDVQIYSAGLAKRKYALTFEKIA